MRRDNLLENIIYPYSLNNFMESYYGKNILHIKRNNSKHYNSIFSDSLLDDILSFNIVTDMNLRVSKIDNQIYKNEYCVYDDFYNEHQINVGKVMDLFNDGASVIIDNISKFNRDILDVEIEISNKVGFVKNISSNLYLTPPDCQAFPLHYDTSEIFIIQIAGTKTWELFDYSKELFPLKNSINHIVPENEVGQKITLFPGDLIYMPRGVSHKVYTDEESSLHLTISIFPYTITDLFKVHQMSTREEDNNFRKNLTDHTSIKEIKDLFLNSLNEFALKKILASLRTKNRYSELYDYSDVINSIFDEIDFDKVSLKFRKNVVIEYADELTLIQYGTKKVELEGDFSSLSILANNDGVLKLTHMLPYFEYEVSKELIYLLLKEGVVYKI